MPLRDCRAQGPGRAARGALATHPLRACVRADRAPLPATRCAAAPTSTFRAGYAVGLIALCGQSQRWARGSAVATRPSQRLRPSAKPQAPGSAPSPRSRTAARQAQAARSIMRWSGPAGRLCDLIAFHQSALHLLVRVCVAEAESMATDLSRSPLYVRGGRLHAFEKLFALTLYIDRKIWPERCFLAQRSGGLRGRFAGTGTA